MTPAPPERRSELPREWRIPPWQPALLFLVVTGLVGYDLYGSPSLTTVVLTVFLAVVLATAAGLASRYLLVADEDGIWVRGLAAERCVTWPEVRSVDVVSGRRGSATVRITRVDGSFLDVPASLLLPSRPTKIEKARAVVYDVADQLADLAATRRRT
jgi:hypothetical protein